MKKIGRNDPCICGSGKKYKKCCLNERESGGRPAPKISRNQPLKNPADAPRATHKKTSNLLLINHPSMPILRYGEDKMGFNLHEFSLPEFLERFAQGTSAKFLIGNLIRLNNDSPLKHYFARDKNKIFYIVYNQNFESFISVDDKGEIRNSKNKKEIDLFSVFYAFFCLLKQDQCPWDIPSLKKTWEVNHDIARSLFNNKNTKRPIQLSALYLNSDLISEKEMVPLGEVTYSDPKKQIDLIPREPHLKNSDYLRKTLVTEDPQTNGLHRFIFNGRMGSWSDEINGGNTPITSDWNHIEFIFNDRTILPIGELLSHPYAVLLPTNLLPVSLHQATRFKSGQIWSENQPENLTFEFKKRLDVNKMFLENFLKSKEFLDKKVDLYLKLKEASLFPSALYKIEEFNSDNPLQYEWTLSEGKIKGENKAHLNTIGGLHFIAGKSKTIELNSFFEQKESFKIFATQFLQPKLATSIDEEYEVHALIDPNYKDIGYTISQFQEEIQNQFPITLKVDALIIPKENIKIQFFIDNNNDGLYSDNDNDNTKEILNTISSGIQIELGPGLIFQMKNLPPFFSRCVRSLAGGIGEYFYEHDNRWYASPFPGLDRKNELKLLRHSGIFCLIFAECIRYLKEENKTQPNLNFKNELLQKIEDAAQNNLDMPSFNFKTSVKIKNFIVSLIDSIIETDQLSHQVFNDKEKIYQVDLKLALIDHFESLLESLSLVFGQSILTKKGIKTLNYHIPPIPLKYQQIISPQETFHSFKSFNLLSSSEAIRGFIGTMGIHSHELYIKGKKLQALSDSDFTSSLFIGENEGRINWFDLHPKVFLNGKELNFEKLQEMKKNEIIFFEGIPYSVNFNKIPKLKFLDRFWARLQNAKKSKNSRSENSEIIKKEKSILLEVLSMRNAGIEIHACEEWNAICHEFDQLILGNFIDLTKLSDFNVPLKEYQKTGTQWLLNLYKIKLGGVLADDMGLGKTIQAIGFLEALRLQKNDNFHLIVVPTSLIYNWTSEFNKFAPLINIVIFESKNKKDLSLTWKELPPKVVITTYGVLAENTEFFNQFEWNTLIFDEAQNLKNITSQRTSAARSMKAKSIFCITGTPMENHYGEFFSLMDLCVPGALGDYSEFKKTFSMDKMETKSQEALKTEIQFLKLKTSPLVLRRLKSEILNQLPEKTESSILIPFEKKQKEIYRNIAIAWDHKIKSVLEEKTPAKTQLEMLTALLRLRQVCSFPAMIEKVEYSKTPPKIELLYEAIEEIYEKGESILIFTNFLATLNEISSTLKQKGYTTHTIHGGINSKKRQDEIKAFQENTTASILIMTLKTGGVGLNLTKANYVFHIEPWWNPASENQATDRAHRMGQTKAVQVYKYIMKDSVEEKIQKLKGVKGQAFDMLFNESNNFNEESEEELNSVPVFKGQLSYSDFQNLLS